MSEKITRPGEVSEATLVRLVDASLPVRAMSRVGDTVVAAWRSSSSAAIVHGWQALPLDRRVRLASAALIVAVVTHLMLTGFRAPEPTWWARAVWVVLLVTLTVAGIWSRAVAVAWTTWTLARTAFERRTS